MTRCPVCYILAGTPAAEDCNMERCLRRFEAVEMRHSEQAQRNLSGWQRKRKERSGVMTANEKAATYLGWRANCSIHRGDERCSKVPDMTKPDNYMRALEAIAVRLGPYGYCSVGVGTDGEKEFDVGIHPFVNGELRQFEAFNGTGKTIGEAAVKVLCALYDAEHKEREKGG